MLFLGGGGGGCLLQITTITPPTTTTKTTTTTTTTRKPQRQQQQQEKQPQHHQQQHTENNNHKNKNKASSDHFLKEKQTNNRERQKQDPEKNKKLTKLPPNCSWLKNRAEKRAHPPNAFTLQKQAFQRIKHKISQNVQRRHFLHTHTQICFKLVYALYRWTMWPKKNAIFIRAAPRQTEIALGCPVQKFRCVCFHKTELLAHGVGNLWFFAFFWLPHFSSEMPIFTVRNTCGPRTGS